jgi:hypothetical protein
LDDGTRRATGTGDGLGDQEMADTTKLQRRMKKRQLLNSGRKRDREKERLRQVETRSSEGDV